MGKAAEKITCNLPGFSSKYERLLEDKIVAGLPLECYYPELPDHYLLGVTETLGKDDLDELVSAVVYLKVPQNSGDLILKSPAQTIRLQPVSGHYVFFDPATPHAVTENLSTEHRLSIGMNFGLTSSKIWYQSAE